MLTQTRTRERKLDELMNQPMEPLEYLEKEEPYLDLTEYGAKSRAARILAKATGIDANTIRQHWGNRFEKCPLHVKLSLRKDHLLKAIARQDIALTRLLTA